MAFNAASPTTVLLPRVTGPFSLVIPPTTYCAGSDVEGEVLLEFPKVQDEQIEEVVVALRGLLEVSVLHTAQRTTSTNSRELIHLMQSIWKRGSAYPPPDSHILRIPFRFHLPSDPKILPSVSWHEWRDSVSISYYVEVTALRPTTLFANDKRIRGRLAVVSRGDPALCASIRSLRRQLDSEGGLMWKTVHNEKKVRRGLWGEYATARVELLVPSEHGVLPHCVDVPVLIQIRTATARLSRAKADKHAEGKPIFPAVALDASNPLPVTLQQHFTVRAGGGGGGDAKRCTNEVVLVHIKPRGLLPSSHYHRHWEADTNASDGEEMGRWVQHWTLQPMVKFHRFPPTFSCDFVDCAYVMSVQVPFPGAGNDVKVSMPITLDSGIDRAVPQKSGGAAQLEQQQTETAATDASEPSGGGTEVPVLRDEEPQSVLPTYFDAVYGDAGVIGEGDGGRDAFVSGSPSCVDERR
ncbi:hypothetical protein V8D89_003983 [Ganoderma adspersum]